jgi:hypothetical protein
MPYSWCSIILFSLSSSLQTTRHYSLWLTFHCIYIYIPQFLIHSSDVGHLGCYQSLAIMNSAAMNIGVQVSLLYPVLRFFWVDAQEECNWIIWQFCRDIRVHQQSQWAVLGLCALWGVGLLVSAE